VSPINRGGLQGSGAAGLSPKVFRGGARAEAQKQMLIAK